MGGNSWEIGGFLNSDATLSPGFSGKLVVAQNFAVQASEKNTCFVHVSECPRPSHFGSSRVLGSSLAAGPPLAFAVVLQGLGGPIPLCGVCTWCFEGALPTPENRRTPYHYCSLRRHAPKLKQAL